MAALEASMYLGLAVLAIGAGLVIRWRVRQRTRPWSSGLSDDEVRRIEQFGSLHRDDEPLDLEEVREAEEKFWQETWDDELI